MRCGKCGCMMTPRSSIGRGRKRYFYYECAKSARTASLDCDTKYVPAKPVESFVLEQLKKAVLSEDEIRLVVERANKQRSQTMKRLTTEETQVKNRLKEVRKKVQAIVLAVEEGTSFKAFKKRLTTLEADEEDLTRELDSITLKKDKTEEKLLSAEIIVDNYLIVPQIIDQLVATENWSRLKSVLSQYIDVIEWNEDENDRRAGTARVMLFEHAYSQNSSDIGEFGETRRETSAPLVNNGALSCNDRLLLTDLNRRPSG
ncbi:MAG: hypothetical protein GY854_04880 [Deltaproteobacteria bacterium]|nr:hypothetical protein [Deltaproteobacteria bacterium]